MIDTLKKNNDDLEKQFKDLYNKINKGLQKYGLCITNTSKKATKGGDTTKDKDLRDGEPTLMIAEYKNDGKEVREKEVNQKEKEKEAKNQQNLKDQAELL